MGKRVKWKKICVATKTVKVNGRKREKKVYEYFIITEETWAGNGGKFNWTKWRRDHPGRQLTVDDIWKGYE